jgi:hypothetical protein
MPDVAHVRTALTTLGAVAVQMAARVGEHGLLGSARDDAEAGSGIG